MSQAITRRSMILGTLGLPAAAQDPVLDIHQHTYYHERSDADLVAHQRAMGVTKTVLLPAGSQYGLAAECGSNETVWTVARAHPNEFVCFANELPDVPETRRVLEKWLKAGAIGIGEQKFPVSLTSPAVDLICSIAREFHVPVLMHFEHGSYNTGFADLEGLLRKYPEVRFIGHAQTWWANISKDADQSVLYPKGPVKAGGLTDRLLSDYPNIYGDLSAGSGLNSLMRDEGHTREFLKRHQDRLLFGSDCNDSAPGTTACTGTQIMATVRRLAEPTVVRKILWNNGAALLRL